jgi:DNA polymerase family A
VFLFVDVESYSSCSLTEAGAFRYAEHPDTELLGIGVLPLASLESLRDPHRRFTQRPEIVHCYRGDRVSAAVYAALQDATTQIVSWGAFDRILLDEAGLGARHGWPRQVAGRWTDAMDLARATNLPDALDVAAEAIGLPNDGAARKDRRGKQLIRRYTMLQKDGSRCRLEDNLVDAGIFLDQYMAIDVMLLARLYAVLPPLSAAEQTVADATWQMNRRGVRIDADLAQALMQVRDWLHVRAIHEAHERHGINIRSHPQVLAALATYSFPVPAHLKTGQPSIGQKLLDRVLAQHENTLDPRACDLLNLRRRCNGTSLNKAEAALARICRDGRVRDMFIYRGSLTDRWSSRDLQLQNLPRPRFKLSPPDVETLVGLFMRCPDPAILERLVDLFFGVSLQDAAISLLRSLIIPDPGNVILVADYKTIEVVTNWMAAGEYGGLAALTAGNDEYLAFARTLQTRINTLCAAANDPDTRRNLEIAREIVASGPREIGKTGLLSIQYGTSPGGLAAQSNIPLALATLMIDEYNLRYPGVAKHQQNLLDAAVAAMRSGLSGRRAEWRVPPMNVRFRYCPAAPGTNLDALEMVRPSGEVVRYLRPQLHEEHRRRTLRTVITHQIYENGTKTYRRDLRLTDQAENCASSVGQIVRQELSGIVGRALDGLTRLQKTGKFTTSPGIEAWQGKTLIEIEPLRELAQYLTVASGQYLTRTELYRGYQRWLRLEGMQYAETQKTFVQQLQYALLVTKGIRLPSDPVRKRVRGKVTAIWPDLYWTEDTPDEVLRDTTEDRGFSDDLDDLDGALKK